MSARARTAEPPSAWPPASQGGRKAARKGERPPWWSRRCESGKVPVSGATEGTRLSLSTLSRRRPPQTYHRPRIAADAPRRTPPLRPPIRLGDGRTPPPACQGVHTAAPQSPPCRRSGRCGAGTRLPSHGESTGDFNTAGKAAAYVQYSTWMLRTCSARRLLARAVARRGRPPGCRVAGGRYSMMHQQRPGRAALGRGPAKRHKCRAQERSCPKSIPVERDVDNIAANGWRRSA